MDFLTDPVSALLLEAIVVIFLIALLCTLLCLQSPFKYPYYFKTFDVSGKRKPCMEDYIDRFLLEGKAEDIAVHQAYIEKWKNSCQEKIDHYILKDLRRKQYEECIDDGRAFVFKFKRNQTRYRQQNYEKIPYTVEQIVDSFSCDADYLLDRYVQLMKLGGEQTLREYNIADQRRLMTPELRKAVMIRDHYTCQICGKYMPDEVGLHIDHIIPVSKGGKSVLSNLQVLCSKCNGSKSNKIVKQ